MHDRLSLYTSRSQHRDFVHLTAEHARVDGRSLLWHGKHRETSVFAFLFADYGQLCRVKAQFLDDPNIPSVQPNVEGGASNYYQLRITMKRVYILEAHDGTEIALINTQMAKALQELDPKGLARYEVYVSVAEWTEKVRTVRASAKSVFLELDIYLFGSIANGARVGKILSDTGLFLQRPDFLDSSISYNNPHEIVFPSVHGSSTEWVAPALAPNSVSNLSVDMINTVLGNLEQMDSLTAVDINTAIVITKLKP